jgi:predicted DCC family thiol-disulfide oxidoreductase YuxK
MAATYDIEVFYDGQCPLCTREIAFLRRRDKKWRIRFSDVSAEDFDPTAYGIAWSDFMAEIHGRLPDGSWVKGVEVFRRLYGAVGLGWLLSPTRVPGLKQLADLVYRRWAKNRLRLTGRCDPAGCEVN